MSNPKRASMREGPLAALFRKTEEDEATEAGAQAPHPALDVPPPQTPAPKDRLKPGVLVGDPGERDGPGEPRPEPATRPVMDEYEREHPSSAYAGGPVGQPRDPRRRRRRRGRERRQPNGRGGGRGRRVPGGQHRPAVAAAVDRGHHPAHRRGDHARAGVGIGRERRQAGRDGGLRPRQGAAEGLGHDLHHRGRRRRHGHGRRADRGADRARSRRADGRDRDQAVRVRGLAPLRAGRARDRRAGRGGRHADRGAEQPPAERARQADRDGRGVPRSPTTCCARACRASPIW